MLQHYSDLIFLFMSSSIQLKLKNEYEIIITKCVTEKDNKVKKRNDGLNMHREVSEKMHYKLLLTNN